MTQVARESILASPSREKGTNASLPMAGDSTKTVPDADAAPKTSSSPLARPSNTSRRSAPLDAQTTKVNVTSSGASEARNADENGSASQPATGKPQDEEEPKTNAEQSAAEQTIQPEQPSQSDGKDKLLPSSPSGWLDWLPRPGLGSQARPAVSGSENTLSEVRAELEATPTENRETTEEQQPEQPAPVPSTDGLTETQQYGRSWFGYWSAGSDSKTMVAQGGDAPDDGKPKPEEPKPEEPIDTKVSNDLKDPTKGEASDVEPAPAPPTTSTWAFWSRMSTGPPKNAEPADAATASHGSNESAKTESQNEPVKTDAKPVAKDAAKPVKEPPKDANRKAASQTQQEPSRQTIFEPSTSTSTAAPSNDTTKTAPKQDPQKVAPPNLLLPSFRNTYQVTTSEPFLQYLARLLLRGKQSPPKHVSLQSHPPRIKRALAIGIHGFFPAQFVRTFIGRPTGTSFKFASAAADAIRDWTKAHGYECEVEAIALEGEGKIAERIDLLWKMLLKWIDKIQKADFIFVACHSQGVPVATMLVAKLIEFGCVNAARVGICAMAGINLGPFPDYKSRLFSGSASELFEFSDSNSAVSKRYEDALRVAVKHGVRIVYVGSLDDQLVPMEVCNSYLLPHNMSTKDLFCSDTYLVLHLRQHQSSIYLPRSIRRRKSACSRLVSPLHPLSLPS